VYVNAGPVAAEGYDWYQVASVRQPYRGDCGDPAPAPSLECSTYFGWVAAADTNGTPWLEDASFACHDGRDVEAYLAMLPAERLACAGNEEWTLRAYVPPMEGGRGCLPAYVVTPDWLDGSCNFTFLQREEREDDAFEGLQVFLSPELSACIGFNGDDCPFTALKGSWVSVQGHLDDPAASTCEAVPSDLVPAPDDPPDPDAVIFGCRLAFVVTAISPEA
jgi:hypothetical protein